MALAVSDVSELIQSKIHELDLIKNQLQSAYENKARAIAEYDRELAKAIIVLSLDNPVTIVEKLARGNLWERRLAMETADGLVRSLLAKIEICITQTTGYQTIFKYQTEV